MALILQISTENAAFSDGSEPGDDFALRVELARILRRAADKIECGVLDSELRDVNGNVCGGYALDASDVGEFHGLTTNGDVADALEALGQRRANGLTASEIMLIDEAAQRIGERGDDEEAEARGLQGYSVERLDAGGFAFTDPDGVTSEAYPTATAAWEAAEERNEEGEG